MLNINNLPPVNKTRINELAILLTSFKGQYIHVNPKLAMMIIHDGIDRVIGRDNRLALFSAVFGREIKTTNDLTIEELRGIIEWADPRKVDQEWAYGAQFMSDVTMLHRASIPIKRALPVVCRMCNHGTVKRLVAHPDHPGSTSAMRRTNVTCTCCKGNWKDCHTCRILGN